MAALTGARAGADVILAEEDNRMGGRLLAEVEDIDGKPAHVWAGEVLAELGAMDNVRLMTRTSVTGAYDQGTYSAIEKVSHHLARSQSLKAAHLPRECFWRINAKASVLAAGAIERPIAFKNNDRPGIMTAGAVRTYLNRYGVAPGERVTVFANNNDAHKTARDLAAAGVHIAAVIDSRHDAPDSDLFPVMKGAVVCNTAGRKRIESITVRSVAGEEEDPDGSAGHVRRLEPLGASDLPPERAPCLEPRAGRVSALRRRCAGHVCGRGRQWYLFHRRCPDRRVRTGGQGAGLCGALWRSNRHPDRR